MNTILAILAIGVLIVVHEAGHYIVARLCSMRVERFSIGFGPAILSRKSKKTGTQFQIAPIPFGGFVEIKGMNILEEVDPNDATAYPNRPVWQRFATIFAGPATNYLFAVVLAFGLFAGAGLHGGLRTSEITEVRDGSAAAGVLQKGDKLVGVEGKPMDVDLSVLINEIGDRDAEFQIERDGQPMTVVIHPKYDDEARSYRLGIGHNVLLLPDRVDVGIATAAKEAIIYPVVQTKAILVGLYEFITGKQEGRVSSVVGITQVTKQAIDDGLVTTLSLLMILNVYLGLFNLFPLPALDGGRLVFLGYEMVTRRRANPKLEASIHMVGVLVLAVLLVVVTVNDCRHL
jgi:regulator of sigma E protease